ncbi:MAG TPA: hypothetical protein VK066_06840 [Chloroflexota bacterium]|nr:hypothetical protein [Chloroflexota bacterium]
MKCDEEAHVEVTPHPAGSDANFAACLPLAAPGSLPCSLRGLLSVLANPRQTVRLCWPADKARSTIVLLVMHSPDTFVHLVSRPARSPGRRWSVQQWPGDKSPAWPPRAITRPLRCSGAAL